MPQAATLVINDGQSTPVAHDFEPLSISSALSMFRDNATGETIKGHPTLSIGLTPAGTNGKVEKVSIRVAIPQEYLADGVYHVDDTTRVSIEFALPITATTQNRADILAYAKNALANAGIAGYVTDGEPFWG